MIYHCEDHTCNYWDEGEKLPERCPQCGRKLLRANETDMTGDDWTALGNTLWDAEASDKKRTVDCFRKAAYLGSAWGVYNLGICMEQGNGVEADRSGFLALSAGGGNGEPECGVLLGRVL